MLSMSVPSRVKLARELRGLSQRELSLSAGLSNAYVTMVERSLDENGGATIQDPSTRAIARLAKALKVRVEWLAFGSGPMTNEPPQQSA